MPADSLIIALPSKGKLGDDCDRFLARAGLPVYKPNRRQYTAAIPSLPQTEVVYQRPRDCQARVAEGLVDIGITSLDIFAEHSEGSTEAMIIDRLGFAKCALLLAVPNSWTDVSSIVDLADFASRRQESGAPLRIASQYRNLVARFLRKQGINDFKLVHADGALEAAPRMGYADMIADISETGTTLRENQLRPLDGGNIIKAQAVLIGNRRNLRESAGKLEILRELIERIEAHRRARQVVSLQANIAGDSIADVQRRILANPALSGSKGPGVIAVASPPGSKQRWFETNLLVRSELIHKTMQHLRALGGTDIIVTRPDYVFDAQSATYDRFEAQLHED